MDKKLERLAWLLDASIGIPGTRWRIGLDGIIGLIPGVGDLLTTGASSYIIYHAAKRGMPFSVLLRMMMNVGLELVVGSIPLIGDIFDFIFKANLKNIALMREYEVTPDQVQQKSRAEVGVVLIVMLALMAGLIWLTVEIIAALIGLIST